MHESGWGFDAYRASFEDDELFQRYIDYLLNAMIWGCEAEGQGHLASTASLYPKEEPGGQYLENLSLDEMRKLHMEWIAALERDDPENLIRSDYTRQAFFMLVNDEVLERFRAVEEKLAKENREPEYCFEGLMAIMCVGYEQDEDDDDDDNELVGRIWQRVWADSISELYSTITDTGGESWFTTFAYAPEVYGSHA